MSNHPVPQRFSARLSKGFSLLEVMVALLVLSIGLLGLAGLQTFSLKFNHQSYERTQATLQRRHGRSPWFSCTGYTVPDRGDACLARPRGPYQTSGWENPFGPPLTPA